MHEAVDGLRLRRQQWARVWGRTSLGTFRECFGWAAYLLPAVMAFHISLDALTVVVRKFRSVSALMAEGSRLEGLVEALSTSMAAAQQPQPLLEEVPGPFVEAAGVALHLPNGSQLYEDLSFQIKDGQRLIILGPSGAGKTTLIRALAGLWSDGDGDLRVSSSTVFLPQEPYIPEGSLRRVLTFPEEACLHWWGRSYRTHEFHKLMTKVGVHFSDEQILACAERARLQEVLQRFGQLEAEADWETVLSRGEKQRCAFCRLLLLRPKVAVLDEATSALDEATEGLLYEELLDPQQGPEPRLQKRMGEDPEDPVSVVSISHRPALSRFHTHILRYQEKLNSPGGPGSPSLREQAEGGFQEGSRDNDSDYRGPRENPAEGMPPIDDEEEDPFADVNVTATIDKLLALPFESAMAECKELRAYVHSPERSKEEISELEIEFRESWSPEAPQELRELLDLRSSCSLRLLSAKQRLQRDPCRSCRRPALVSAPSLEFGCFGKGGPMSSSLSAPRDTMGPRKRDRSKTPEVPWELLPNGNSIGIHAGHSRSRSHDRTANGKNGHARAPAPAPAPDPALLAAQAAEVERDAWRRLVILLAQLKGDRKVEQLLREKHPELLQAHSHARSAMATVEGVTEVRPKLYLSARDPATVMKSLTVLGISHILQLDAVGTGEESTKPFKLGLLRNLDVLG
eukprot:s1075_g14.t1